MAYTTIDDPSAYFQTTIYTGTGSDNTAITNVGNSDLQPDFIWIKKRSATGQHVLSDTNRGIVKVLNSNSTAAEDSNSEGEMVKSVQSDGFTLGDSQAGQGDTNFTSGGTYVAWQWKANGGTTASNSDGSITSTVQANTTAGFSIVTYNGEGDSQATVGHGLGVKPQVIIPKIRGTTGSWHMYHEGVDSSAPENYGLLLNANNARADDPGFYNDTAPTSSVFTVGTYNNFNNDYVAYCFAEKQGYSKFGRYTGNQSTDGPFLYFGFKPAFLMVKKTTSAENWFLIDNKRHPFNDGQIPRVIPNNTDAESEDASIAGDFLSNGFKIKATQNMINESGTYIYMAFAEHPFVSSKGVPTTAR